MDVSVRSKDGGDRNRIQQLESGRPAGYIQPSGAEEKGDHRGLLVSGGSPPPSLRVTGSSERSEEPAVDVMENAVPHVA